jgi:hypothetical protein
MFSLPPSRSMRSPALEYFSKSTDEASHRARGQSRNGPRSGCHTLGVKLSKYNVYEITVDLTHFSACHRSWLFEPDSALWYLLNLLFMMSL